MTKIYIYIHVYIYISEANSGYGGEIYFIHNIHYDHGLKTMIMTQYVPFFPNFNTNMSTCSPPPYEFLYPRLIYINTYMYILEVCTRVIINPGSLYLGDVTGWTTISG